MKSAFETLSLGSGAAVIAVLSTLVACAMGLVRAASIRWASTAVVPFMLSYCLYWAPVWLGADRSEYFGWEYLAVGAWFLAGAIPSAAVMLFVGRYRAKTTTA